MSDAIKKPSILTFILPMSTTAGIRCLFFLLSENNLNRSVDKRLEAEGRRFPDGGGRRSFGAFREEVLIFGCG